MKLENKNIGIVGQGFVGTAVKEKLKESKTIYAYDLDDSKCGIFSTKDEYKPTDIPLLVDNCDIIFVCVPTPMYATGKCNTGIVENVLTEINNSTYTSNNFSKNTIVIIKSTIPPGTTESFNKKYKNIGIVFSPEFLTEANSIEDFKNQNRIILGIDWAEHIKPVTKVFKDAFPDAEIAVLYTADAELTKYMTNLFLATKVSFFNDMYKLTESINNSENLAVSQKIKFDSVVDATLLDPRIGKSHTLVPGPDGDFGYGGHCFPKDMAAILSLADQLGASLPTLFGASTTNSIVRTDRDWEKMEGRAVSNDEKTFEHVFPHEL